LHGREVLGLVDDDVAVSAWGIAADQYSELLEADVVVECEGIGVGAGSTGPQQDRLLVLVEDAVGAVLQKVGRVVEAAQGFPGARGRPDPLDEALDPAITLKVTADRASLAAARCYVGELPEEPVNEEAAEMVASLPEGPLAGVSAVEEDEDLGLRYAESRTAGGDDDRGLVALEGGGDGKSVESPWPVIALDATSEHGRHTRVRLHTTRAWRVGAEDRALPQPVQLDGIDIPGAKGGKNLANVIEEPLVRADDEDVVGPEVLVVDEPGHTMQTDR
jgi:hypothetical protein